MPFWRKSIRTWSGTHCSKGCSGEKQRRIGGTTASENSFEGANGV